MITSGPLEKLSGLVSIGLRGEVPDFPEEAGRGGETLVLAFQRQNL